MNNLTLNLNSLHLSSFYDEETKIDREHISKKKDEVIAGFLSIGKKDNWMQSEGGLHETGFRFTRCMFRKFCSTNLGLTDYQDILDATSQAFSATALDKQTIKKGLRVAIDASIQGWLHHSISRIFGFLGTQAHPNGPFVEILINSAHEKNEVKCFPFHVTVLSNKEGAEARWNQLYSVRSLSEVVATPVFYSLKQDSIKAFKDNFRKEHAKDPGPNALRLLEGLDLLKITQMKGQTTGNCWMKQNKRQVLVLLFINTLTYRGELSISQAWRLSKKLYSKWKVFTDQAIKDLMKERGMCLDLVKIASIKLTTRASKHS